MSERRAVVVLKGEVICFVSESEGYDGQKEAIAFIKRNRLSPGAAFVDLEGYGGHPNAPQPLTVLGDLPRAKNIAATRCTELGWGP